MNTIDTATDLRLDEVSTTREGCCGGCHSDEATTPETPTTDSGSCCQASADASNEQGRCGCS
ncbi:Uncharacterised protein [Mycobacteroides abscessus subsp. abscessus]|nr:Uncharacterised protein [Mycobacteroides abscessus subsp. abscessus]